MRSQRTLVEGPVYPATLLGRWMDRAQDRDEAEQRREAAQREVQARREGTWAATQPTDGDLLDYRQLYALWERQNWRVHELDFSVDREHWVASPREAQENMLWSLGSFYIGEERVTADLAPFVRAAPTGEIEAFLSTQLVDEARHAVFFDRYGAEVLALDAEDLRGRMLEIQSLCARLVRSVAAACSTWPTGYRRGRRRELLVDGIQRLNLIIEGVLATPDSARSRYSSGTRSTGLLQGLGRASGRAPPHRVGCVSARRGADDPSRGEIICAASKTVPKACHVFVPP